MEDDTYLKTMVASFDVESRVTPAQGLPLLHDALLPDPHIVAKIGSVALAS